jgi:hypothetical protein
VALRRRLHQLWADNFHTAYILTSLARIVDARFDVSTWSLSDRVNGWIR